MKLTLYIPFLLLINSLSAQLNVKGKISNYQSDSAEIILPVEEPTIIGTINKKGKFTIRLENNMATTMTKEQEKSNLKSSAIRIKNKTVGGSNYHAFGSIIETSDNGYAATGRTDSENTSAGTLQGDGDYWLVKFEAETLSINKSNSINEVIIHPNPVSKTLNIKIKNSIEIKTLTLYNILGQPILKSSEKSINMTLYPNGLYPLKIETNKGTVNKRVVVK